MTIRPATPLDLDAIRDVHRAAFPENERDIIAELAGRLLTETTHPPTFSFVAEVDGKVVGHVAFSPAHAHTGEALLGYILAPLAVSPEFQRQGVGSALIHAGIGAARSAQAPLLLVYGDPAYYGRFGFAAKLAEAYPPTYPLQYPFGWQALQLLPEVPRPNPATLQCAPALGDERLW